jgi:hypothetical protein
VTVDKVTVTVADARRHLLAGVVVEYTIATADAGTAASIAKSIEATPAATIVTEMQVAGLAAVTTATVTVTVAPPAELKLPPLPSFPPKEGKIVLGLITS